MSCWLSLWPQKNAWGTLTGDWVPHDTRDQLVDFVRCWSAKTEICAGRFIAWLDITASKFYDWRERYGKVNEHVSYLNIGGTFYYLCSILDGFSRYIVNWDIRESMTEASLL